MAIPHLVAHRGYMDKYPENTIVALEAALLCGAQFVEFDVQRTADGQFVVFHDTQLKRTTGVEGQLFELTYKELENTHAHEPERFSLAFFSQRIPRLKDMVALLQDFPKATAFIEIKEESLEHFGVETVVTDLLKQLDDIQQQCIIISFHHEALVQVQKSNHYRTGWVLHQYDQASRQLAIDLNPDVLIINHRKLPTNQEPWGGDWDWMVYDITDPELALHYASYNIPLIETRDICTMLEHPVLMLNHMAHES